MKMDVAAPSSTRARCVHAFAGGLYASRTEKGSEPLTATQVANGVKFK
jgi:hypothetical protein